MKTILIYTIPLITALIGWLTNWLAIKMLFRPKIRLRLGFISIQGVIPKRRQELAKKISAIVERELLSTHTLQQEISHINIQPFLQKLTHRLVHEKLKPKLSNIPLVGSFINESMLLKLEGMANESIEEEANLLMNSFGLEIEKRIHIQRMIEEKINAFDLDKLEDMVLEASKKEFKVIEYLGAILGLLVGLVQLGLYWVF